jgi:hypothetical protein
MHVGDAAIGEEVFLASPDVLEVSVTLHVSAGENESGQLYLIRNGGVVAVQEYAMPQGGTVTMSVSVPFLRSAWIAASADSGAHTGAVYVSVGDRPIATVTDTGYWLDYCDDLEEQIGVFEVPSVEPAILARVGAARQIFTALQAVVLPLPQDVVRYGHSTPACQGPIAIGVDAPPSSAFRLTCLNAPPDTMGLLVLGLAANTIGTTALGATLFVDLSAPYVTTLARTNSGGYAESPLFLPSGANVVAQFVWNNTGKCGNGEAFSASDALQILIP